MELSLSDLVNLALLIFGLIDLIIVLHDHRAPPDEEIIDFYGIEKIEPESYLHVQILTIRLPYGPKKPIPFAPRMSKDRKKS